MPRYKGDRRRTAGSRKRASHTATKIARDVVYLGYVPEYARFLPEGASESLERLGLAAGILKPWMGRLFKQRWYQRLMDRMLKGMYPGELMRLVLRKRFVDDEIRMAVDDGATQLLILGAGFDTVGLRMAECYSDLCVIELDTAATVEKRRAAIVKAGLEFTNHHLVSANLAEEPMGEVLRSARVWGADNRTVVVAEGVVMYLAEQEVSALLNEIKGNSAPGSRFVFSYVMADERGRPALGRMSALMRTVLKLLGEPIRWGVSEGQLQPLLREAGFHLAGGADRFDLRQRYLTPAGVDRPVGQVERFAVAEWS